MAKTYRERIAEGATRIKRVTGVAIKYGRDDLEIEIEKAVKFPPRKRSQFVQVAIDLTAQDWGIAVEDLSELGTEPQRGDRITFVESGEVFEVLPDEGDSTHHKIAADTQYRVHSKQIE